MRKPSRSSINRRDLLILDTGPIRELVAFHAVEELGFHKLRNHLRFFLDGEAYERCTDFVGSFRRKITSASVVAELHSWIRETDSDGRIELWKRVYDEFRNMGMDEDVVKLVDMDMRMVANYGPVDTSILEIAKRNSGVDPLVLTIDDKLAVACKRALITALNLNEIIYSVMGR